MSVQDASGTDNANFATPPDGQSGQCRMYIWDYTSVSSVHNHFLTRADDLSDLPRW